MSFIHLFVTNSKQEGSRIGIHGQPCTNFPHI